MRVQVFKRVFDLTFALLSLIVLAPLFIVLYFVVRWFMGRPIIFRQRRPGLDEQIFTLNKFRTMQDLRNASGNLLPDEQRLTWLGKFLRRTSLDELPQLINVIKGDMALVGPRPLFIEYLPYYTERERQRHKVRPGITGLAQISGRNLLPWDERLELDVQYVERQSLILDLSILLKTFYRVIARKDIIETPGAVRETSFSKERKACEKDAAKGDQLNTTARNA